MFDFLFGWRKASKCRTLIKQVRCRLKLLKNKRCAIAKQLREDVIQLIKHGYEQAAFNRVEQIIRDDITVAAYDLLDHFCDFILNNLSYIQKHKDCPNDINEAVSSLMYASARCGDLPELQLIRKLFAKRYGHRFEMTAIELCPGNLVNSQIKEELSIKHISDDDKDRMMKEISKECFQPQLLALEYHPDWFQKQVVLSSNEIQTYEGPVEKVHNSYLKFQQQPPQYMLEMPNDKKSREEDEQQEKTCNISLEHEEEQKISASSCESLPQFPDEKIVYLDDVVELELCPSTTREGDRRLFKFKSAALPPKGDQNVKDEYNNQTDTDQSVSWNETDFNSSSKSSEMRRTENLGLGTSDKEIEWASFYKKHKRKRRKRRVRNVSCDIKSAAYDAFTYPGCDCNIENNETIEKTTKSNTQKNRENIYISNSKSMMNEDGMRNDKEPQGPYLRAVTLPPERPRDSIKTNFGRTNSCPGKQLNHVHPKLPDYEDIAAKFMAMKREHMGI